MFIRTKTTICEIRKYLKGDNAYKILDGVCEGIILKNAYIMEKDIISQTENIEDLLDEVLVSNNGKITNMLSDIYDEEECVNLGKKVYGAIWVDTETKPTLKSVAKYKGGKWVLL